MSKLKNDLLNRKRQLEQQLKPYDELLEELAEVNQAIASLESSKQEPSTCDGALCFGCSICRRGPNYR